jgi:hypothetical protein
MRTMRLLIAEDDADLRQVLSDLRRPPAASRVSHIAPAVSATEWVMVIRSCTGGVA